METLTHLVNDPVYPARWQDAGGWHRNFDARPANPTRLLLVHDGQRDFAFALADLKKAGLPAAVEVEILTVSELFSPPLYFTDCDPDLTYCFNGDRHDNFNRAYHADLKGQLDQASVAVAQTLQTAFPRWVLRHGSSTDHAAKAVIEKARRWQPDLVVVGSADLSWFERNRLRALIRGLVCETRCSVRVVRPSRAIDDMENRILIGLDGSRTAEAAVDAVLHRTWNGGSVCLISCTEPLVTSDLDWTDDYLEQHRLCMAEQIDQALRRLEQAGLTVQTIMQVGSPAQTIVEEARHRRIDSIFLGTRELGVIENLLFRSVSATVAAKADCSVEIVRTGTEPQPQPVERRLAA